MTDELITFETAKLAKEAGFNIPVYHHYSENPVNDLMILCKPDDPQVGQGWVLEDYNNSKWSCKKYSAPTQSLLQRWFREIHAMNIEVPSRELNESGTIVYIWDIYWKKLDDEERTDDDIIHDTYEHSLEEALQEALKLIIKRKLTSNGVHS